MTRTPYYRTRNTLPLITAVSLCLLGISPNASALVPKQKPFLVVIDPGHGGSDHGASVKTNNQLLTEKEVTLSLSRQIALDLAKSGIRAVLTRTTDVDLPLPERTAIANRLGASVFLSIHMNSSQELLTASEGVETYILNNSTDLSSKRLADLENAVLQGSVAHAMPESDVALIVKDLMLDANLSSSKRLACMVQNQVVSATSTPSTRYRNRGVKQALFYVLLGADMPSILVEAGFLNNPRDRQILSSVQGQRQISLSITRAILQFKTGASSPAAQMALSSCKIGEHPLSARKSPPTRVLTRINKQFQ